MNMALKCSSLILLLAVSANAGRMHKGPKVSGTPVNSQTFGRYVQTGPQQQQFAPQQALYKPQPQQFQPQPQLQGQYQPQQGQAQFRDGHQQQQFQPQPQQQGQYQPQQVQYRQPQPIPYQPQQVQYQAQGQYVGANQNQVTIQNQQKSVYQAQQQVQYQSTQPIQPVEQPQPIESGNVALKTQDITNNEVDIVAETEARQSYRPQSSRPVPAYKPATTNIYNSYKPVNSAYRPATTNTRGSYKPYINQNAINSVLNSAPANAYLLRAEDNFGNTLVSRLIDNYTLIRPAEDIVEGFSCQDRNYGYYGDVANDCQIFHICLPLGKLPWPLNKDGSIPEVPNTVYHFSFICPKYTAFSQDAMVCAWKNEAVQCSLTEQLYKMNDRFFQDIEKTPTSTSLRG